MNEKLTKPISRSQFWKSVRSPILRSLDEDKRLHNLAKGFWVYDELIADLRNAGWIRFGPGFKAGVYGHPKSPYCIKILGMGVGENPLYFCERGYYIEHERNMLVDFWESGFRFAPTVLNRQDSISFLRKCGVRPFHDVMVMEYIPGIPLAIQTGRHLDYDVYLDAFDTGVLDEMHTALETLRIQLQRANNSGVFHNDPMPPNIIFTMRKADKIEAKLVDFEMAQNSKKSNPTHVNSTVETLYRERGVPVNQSTLAPMSNLDIYLIDQSIDLVKRIRAASVRPDDSLLDAISIGVSFIGGFSINLGRAIRSLKGG